MICIIINYYYFVGFKVSRSSKGSVEFILINAVFNQHTLNIYSRLTKHKI
jgi:hypothetical protein